MTRPGNWGLPHEEFYGAPAHEGYYRAERRSAEKLDPSGRSFVVIDGHSYRLYDVSLSGVSFNDPQGLGDAGDLPQATWDADSTVEARVLVRDEVAYEGKARVAWTAPRGRRLRVALAMLDTCIDLPNLERRLLDKELAESIAQGTGTVRSPVPAGYRSLVEEAIHMVQHYRLLLDRHEHRFLRQGDEGPTLVHEMVQATLARLRPQWDTLRRRASEFARSFERNSEVWWAAKSYTETVLTPLLLDAPVVARSYNKPLDYAGDYMTMLHIYRNGYEGATAAAQVFHKLAVEEPLAEGVRTRSGYLQDLHRKLHARFCARSRAGHAFRVLSLGAGPAREVLDLLPEGSDWTHPVHWTLVDMEQRALNRAYEDSLLQIHRQKARATVRCVHRSFAQILQASAPADGGESQDFIYLAGLMDYVTQRQGRRLISRMFAALRPGGCLAICNAHGPNSHFWFGEYVLDWPLRFRSEEQLLALGSELPANAERRVQAEPSGAYRFLIAEKK